MRNEDSCEHSAPKHHSTLVKLQGMVGVLFIAVMGYSVATNNYNLEPLVSLLLLAVTQLGLVYTFLTDRIVESDILIVGYIGLSSVFLVVLNVLDLLIGFNIISGLWGSLLFPMFNHDRIVVSREVILFFSVTSLLFEINLESRVAKRIKREAN